jgi:hypothetical protein
MDPLKPFTSIIRSFWEQYARRADGNPRSAESSATTQQKLAPVKSAPAIQTLHSRLRSRLATLAQWDPSRARQLFVECALTAELGDELARDPAFANIVQRVSQQLESDWKLSSRLDSLLKRVAAGEAVA